VLRQELVTGQVAHRAQQARVVDPARGNLHADHRRTPIGLCVEARAVHRRGHDADRPR